MPRNPRTEVEVEAVRARILDEALELFAEAGWEGFSMRKLGARLDVAAKTIYNYVESRDEIYLGLLIRGFRQLHSELVAATSAVEGPWEQVSALVGAYVDFGLANTNMYNLMFTWHVPKYDDYVGTPLEDLALVELEAALENQRLLAALIVACVGDAGPVSDDDLRFVAIRAWTQMHGYVAGLNSNIIGYMHPEPGAIRNRMVGQIQACVTQEIADLRPASATTTTEIAR
jgi:AcrR family transcriptional regulator